MIFKIIKFGGIGNDFGTRHDILNPLNGVYNKDTDSISLEATIKILH